MVDDGAAALRYCVELAAVGDDPGFVDDEGAVGDRDQVVGRARDERRSGYVKYVSPVYLTHDVSEPCARRSRSPTVPIHPPITVISPCRDLAPVHFQ